MGPVLVDTHAFLWFVFDDPRLSDSAASVIESPSRPTLLSVASLWEIALKVNIGKLLLGMPFETFIDEGINRRDVELLAIELPHVTRSARLPLLHRDPFDRLLIAQAQSERLPVLTADERFSGYPIETIW